MQTYTQLQIQQLSCQEFKIPSHLMLNKSFDIESNSTQFSTSKTHQTTKKRKKSKTDKRILITPFKREIIEGLCCLPINLLSNQQKRTSDISFSFVLFSLLSKPTNIGWTAV